MFCKHCGAEIDNDVIICVKCGKQVQELKSNQVTPQQSFQQPFQQPNIIINNTNTNTNTLSGSGAKVKDKRVALLLCGFLGVIGAHKFYEGKFLLGVVYVCTLGLCGVGVVIDFIILLFKPNPYY